MNFQMTFLIISYFTPGIGSPNSLCISLRGRNWKKKMAIDDMGFKASSLSAQRMDYWMEFW